jgi:hypothetical protein
MAIFHEKHIPKRRPEGRGFEPDSFLSWLGIEGCRAFFDAGWADIRMAN